MTADQLDCLSAYERLLSQANRRLNLISRASTGGIRTRHVAHSLAISMRGFPAGAQVVDWGTGGGLPGIPLAIRFPDVTFHLVDSIYKKTRKVESFCEELGLRNVFVHRLRAEDWTEPIDYAVSRATAPLVSLWQWTQAVLRETRAPAETDWPSGLLALKGGDLREEIAVLERAFPDVAVGRTSIYAETGIAELKEKYVLNVERRTSTAQSPP